MAESIQPEWMSEFKPKSGKWSRGMKSPNPSGRPRGIIDKRQKVAEALRDDAPAVARVVIDAALAGDMQAAGLVLSRITPTLRSQSEKVSFEFDASLPISGQIEQVLAAIAGGDVAPDVGKQIIDAIGTLSSTRAVEELEQRIITLEARQI